MSNSWFDRHPALAASAISIAGAIMLLLSIEALLRWFAPAIQFRNTDTRLIAARSYSDTHGNARNFDGEVFGTAVRIDANGFRTNPGAQAAAPAGPAIVFLGDSVTFGVGVADGKTFVDLVRENTPHARVINASSIGYFLQSYENVVRTFIVPARERLRISKVVLGICLNDVNRVGAPEFATNDAKDAYPSASRQNADPAKRYSPIAVWVNETFPAVNAYLRSHSKLYLLARSVALDSGRAHLDAAIIVYEDPHVLERSLEALGSIASELRAAGIGLDVLLFPYEYQLRTNAPRTYLPQRVLAEFLSARKIRYFDLAEEFRAHMAANGTKAADYYLFDDPMHLSELGHAVVQRFIAKNRIADP
jgi:lysophospholipase L1-like esterase